ncbi:hypothetical protein PILCRDRAFT_791807 [Piloderma croceum F 1598]|uniref:DUF6533 domain-containing protein n=1 Tax=Piloderma croceum (strain F 1598) TaxID=765440 RepID=A0A0C3BPR9_PILCF|nr:hypothetical protein PILCRDRAFT_791807 [Piloderma croceum F 1598]
MDTESAAVMAQHMQITKYVDAAGLVFLLYDHILTFDDEVRLVWSADTTLPKVLFLINRYFVLFAMIFRTNGTHVAARYCRISYYGVSSDSSGLALNKLSDTFCKSEMNISLFVGMMSIGVSNFLVLLRIWVLWERNRRLMLVFEMLVFVVVWWNALDRPRLQSNVILSQVLFREGSIYFFVLFSLRVLNLVLGIVAPVSLIFVGMLFIWCACTMTTSHLILSLRKLSADGPQGDGADVQRTDIQLQSTDFLELGSVNTVVALDSKI